MNYYQKMFFFLTLSLLAIRSHLDSYEDKRLTIKQMEELDTRRYPKWLSSFLSNLSYTYKVY